MAPKYELIYFDIRGLAEPIRIMFSLSGVEFTDNRLTREEWVKRKPDKRVFPIGQVPVLLVDDKIIPQANAICRFVAKELGFFGESNSEGAQIDVVIETIADIKQKLAPIYAEQEELKRKEKIQEFFATTAKPCFDFLEGQIKAGGGRNFVGNKISLADIHIFHMLDIMTDSKLKVLDDLSSYPELAAFFSAFKEEHSVKAYLNSRPITDY